VRALQFVTVMRWIRLAWRVMRRVGHCVAGLLLLG
jgi:hypothetical protein